MEALGDFVSGTVAGIVGKFVDFPFDTVKTRMQSTQCQYTSTWNCITRMCREEGIRGYYAGIGAPIGGAAFENAVAFFVYGRALSGFTRIYDRVWPAPQREAGAPAPMAPLGCVMSAGMMSGLGTGLVLTPVELLKCRVQANPTKYPGVVACFRTTMHEEGARALSKGLSGTLLREVPGNGCWFLFYELTLRNAFIPTGGTRDDAPWYAFPISGGVGGIFYWSAFFPADTIKTRLQTDPTYETLSFKGAFKRLVADGGVKALYRGFGITLCRAFPANATIFAAYEATSRQWDRVVLKKEKASSS
jgi:hypothetical protein